MKKHLVWLMAVPLLGGCDLDLSGLGGSCDYERNFYDETGAFDMATLRILADAGDLRIEGRTGLNEVRIRGRACSADRYAVDDIDFELFRTGSTLDLETYVPGRYRSRLDLEIEMPYDMAAAIYHQDGDISVRNIDVVFIDDEAGHIDVRGIYFDVDIIDGSGDIDVEDVGGDLIVRSDRSGRIDYRNVRGQVYLP